MTKVKNCNQTNGGEVTKSERLLKVIAGCTGAYEEIQAELDGLPTEEEVLDLAVRVSYVEKQAWYWRGCCLLEVRRRRGLKLPGGKRDDAGVGMTKLLEKFAAEIDVDPRTLLEDIKIITTYGLGKDNLPVVSRAHYRAGLVSPDPIEAVKAALIRGAAQGEYSADAMRKAIVAARSVEDNEPDDPSPAAAGGGSSEEPSNVIQGVFRVELTLTPDERDCLSWIESRNGLSLNRAAGTAFKFFKDIHQQCQQEKKAA